MEAEEVRVGRIAGLDGAGEGLRGLGVALELLVGEAEVDEEDAPVARALLVGGRRPGHDLLEQGRGSGEVAARLGDRDLEVGGLRVLGVGRRQRVGHGRGLVEAAEVPQRSPLEVEREQVRGVGDEHGLRFREGLLGPLRLLEDLAEGEPHADVGGLDLEGLAVVEDRLVGVLGAGVDVPEDLVRAGRAGLKLQGRLHGRRGLVRLARHQEVGAPLDVRLEVAGVERQVHLPRARGLLVHAAAGRRSRRGSGGTGRRSAGDARRPRTARPRGAAPPPRRGPRPGSARAGRGSGARRRRPGRGRRRLAPPLPHRRGGPSRAGGARSRRESRTRRDRASGPAGTPRAPRRCRRRDAPASRG